MPIDYQIETWESIIHKTLKLCKKVESAGFYPDILVSILRGGAIPAAIFSDYFGIKNVAPLRIIFYKGVGETAEEPRIIQPLLIDVRGRNVLIVDDVADTGRTLKTAFEHVKSKDPKEVKIATIHLKPWSIVVPDFFIETTDKWIVYPWEYHEFMREVMEKIEKKELSEEEIKRAKRALERIKEILANLISSRE
ncbi:MAG: phosphoribosyltransferase [Candidatus Njordarchaeales archaeon]